MRVHRLKCWPEFFRAVKNEVKTCEVRRADRDFQVHDYLLLLEFNPEGDRLTGARLGVQITHILRAEDAPRGLIAGFACLSIRTLTKNEQEEIEGQGTFRKPEFIQPKAESEAA